MKQSQFLFLISVMLLIAFGCGGGKPVNLESPEATFQTMTNAIQDQDIETYTQCWHADRANNDGMVLLLQSSPELWKGLQMMFHRDSKLVDRSEGEIDGFKVSTFEVITPGIENGDRISAVSLTKVGSEWKMYHW